MTSPRQPLLDNSHKIKTSNFLKVFGLIITVVVFLGTLDFLASNIHLNFLRFFSSKTLSLFDVCGNTQVPQSCVAMASEVASNGVLQSHDVDPLKNLIEHSITRVKNVTTMAVNYNSRAGIHKNHGAVEVCIHLFELSVDRLVDSVVALGEGELSSSYFDVHTWLSGVLTNHDTCLDGLKGEARHELESSLNDLMARARASLAMLVALSPKKLKQINLLKKSLAQKFPRWLKNKDRKVVEAWPNEIEPNVIVAQDGTGNYRTIIEAVAAAPNNSGTRYVIYVKAGQYVENVKVISRKKNIMLVGDGMYTTLITGSLNKHDGVETFNTGTLIVEGDGFIAQDLWIQNTAGPEKFQAVALRVSSDKTVINRCQIDAYQDTLYTHRDRQFYRDCKILGTIDFIFGNAAVVVQKCTIIARRPLHGQSNMITAQGRSDLNQNTGTSIQMCQMLPSEDLIPVQGSVKSYLGRPWRNYSTTVIMQSYIDDHIEPAGWSLWDSSTNTTSLYYGEYDNAGAGASSEGRVDWPGFHVINDPAVATKFTVAELIQGGTWLNSTGVDYIKGLCRK